MLIQVRSAVQHAAPVTQAKASVQRKLSSRQASLVDASASGRCSRRAKCKALVGKRMHCRREPTTTQLRAPQALPPHLMLSLHRLRPNMSLVPLRRSPSVAHQILSPRPALRVMKEKHVENAETLPSSATARVSNAIRAERRADVARVTNSQP